MIERVPFADFDPRTVPMSWTVLSKMPRSPLHAKYAAWRGKTDEGTLAMKMGRGFHAVALEQPYSVYTLSKQRRGKAWDAFKADHDATLGPSAPILSVAEYERADAMTEALKADPDANRLLFSPGVRREERIEWERGGRKMASNVDFRNPAEWLGDLKSMKDGRPSRYQNTGTWAGHHAQVCLYDEADEFACPNRTKPIDLFLVTIESEAPHVVVVYRLDDAAIEAGRRCINAWWGDLRTCEQTGIWPGYSLGIETFTAIDSGDIPEEPPDDNEPEPATLDESDATDWSAA